MPIKRLGIALLVTIILATPFLCSTLTWESPALAESASKKNSAAWSVPHEAQHSTNFPKPLPHPKGYVCYRASAPLTIDGRLDEAAWKQAPWTDWFVDIEGDAKPKPRFGTRVKMLWDDKYFYIGAILEEPHVWGTLTEHDSVIFQDNDFEVFIDPDGDNHNYCEFEINALNTTWDLLLTCPYRDGGKAVNSWEIPGMKHGVHIDGTLNDPRDTDRGWSVELAFPWKVLVELAHRPMPPQHGDQWRVNFSRVEWLHEIVEGKYRKIKGKPEDNWVWSPQGVIDMHRPEAWGYVQFSMKTAGKDDFAPDPAWPARAALMQLYSVQREYHKKNKRWAKSLDELAVDFQKQMPSPVQLQTTFSGYEAILRHAQKTWHIRSDSRLWAD
jgi:hypothetical protein